MATKMSRRYFGSIALVICTILLCDNYSNALSKDQLKTAVRPIRTMCLANVGVDPALVDAMDKGEFSDDQAFRCYTKCVMIQLKTFKHGLPALNAIMKQIKIAFSKEIQARFVTAMAKCTEFYFDEYFKNLEAGIEEDECTTTWKLVKCTYRQDPEIFFFP